jgi:hypothetical protein
VAALAALVLLASSCSSTGDAGRRAGDGRSPVCVAYDRLDRNAAPLTEDDAEAEVVAKLDERRREDRALAESATGSVGRLAARVRRDGERYRRRFLQRWRAAGDGHALHREALDHGFTTSRQYVESLVEGGDGADRRRGELRERLATRCDGLAPLDGSRFDPGTAPDGQILAVRLGHGEIHQFSLTGRDLGALDLPGLEPPVRDLTVSPDHRRLAFNAGTGRNRHLWLVDLTTGATRSMNAVGCMDWDVDSTHLWASVGPVRDAFIARIAPDGTYDPTTRIDDPGCPAWHTPTSLYIDGAPRDGAPSRIASRPTDGGPATVVASSTCTLVEPHRSPDGDRLLFDAGCSDHARSGVVVADADGGHRHRIVTGTSAAPSWSPDGRWVTFGAYSPGHPGDQQRLRVLVATRDGRRVAPVSPPGYSWPVWVPATPPGARTVLR